MGASVPAAFTVDARSTANKGSVKTKDLAAKVIIVILICCVGIAKRVRNHSKVEWRNQNWSMRLDFFGLGRVF